MNAFELGFTVAISTIELTTEDIIIPGCSGADNVFKTEHFTQRLYINVQAGRKQNQFRTALLMLFYTRKRVAVKSGRNNILGKRQGPTINGLLIMPSQKGAQKSLL